MQINPQYNEDKIIAFYQDLKYSPGKPMLLSNYNNRDTGIMHNTSHVTV